MADLARLVVRLTAQTAEFSSGLNQATNKLGQFEKNVTASANRVNRTLNTIPKALGAAFAGLSAGALAKSVAETADRYQALSSRLKLVTSSAEELRAVQESLFQVAQNTRQPVADIGELFVRVAQNARELGLSQQQLIGFTETVAQAFRVSGASAAESAGAIRQLTQALASGTFRGEEFNSVAEQGPRILQALTDSLGVSRGELRKMAEQGKLTADVVINALQGQAKAIGDEFKQLAPTIGESLTTVRNELFKAFGQLDTSNLIGAIAEVRESLSDPVRADGLLRPIQEVTDSLATLVRLGNQFSGEIATAAFAALSVAIGRYGASLSAVIAQQAAAAYASQQQVALNAAASKSWEKLTASQAAEAAASVRETEATLASILAHRQEQTVVLQVAHANALAAKSALELAAANSASTGASERATAAFLAYAKAEDVAAVAGQKLVLIEERRLAVEAQLAAATTAGAAAQTRAAAAATASAAAISASGLAARAAAASMGALRTALAFVGGPVGAAIVAASAIAYFVSKLESAEERSERLSRRLRELRGDFTDLSAESDQRELEDTQKRIVEVDHAIARLQARLIETSTKNAGGQGLVDKLINSKDASKLKEFSDERAKLILIEGQLQDRLDGVASATDALAKNTGEAKQQSEQFAGALDETKTKTQELKDITDAYALSLLAAAEIKAEIERMEQERAENESRQTDIGLDAADNIKAEVERMAEVEAEKTAILREEEMRRQQIREQGLYAAMNALGDLAYAAEGMGKKGFKAFKAFAIAEAVVATYTSAVNSFNALARWGGPVAGAVGAAAAIAAGLSNVARIRAAEPSGYMLGGYTGDGATTDVAGVVHGKEAVVSNGALSAAAEAMNDPGFWDHKRMDADAYERPQYTVVNNAPGVKFEQRGDILYASQTDELARVFDSIFAKSLASGRSELGNAIGQKFGVQGSQVR